MRDHHGVRRLRGAERSVPYAAPVTADGRQDEPGKADNPVLAFAEQLRAAADRMLATGLPGLPKTPDVGLAQLLAPATASARQLDAVLADLEARRAQVQLLRDQLTTFDEQLGALETSLRPLRDWAKTWADVESAATSVWRRPEQR